MYADDTVIYFSANCCQNIEHHLNADLANLAEWFNNNYLTLNTSKSKFVMFGGDRRSQTCQEIKLVIDQANLESKDSIKYLGVANNFTCLLLRSWNTLHTHAESFKLPQLMNLFLFGFKIQMIHNYQQFIINFFCFNYAREALFNIDIKW